MNTNTNAAPPVPLARLVVLLPCPFCGANGTYPEDMEHIGELYCQCSDDKCRTFGPSGKTWEEAGQMWNTRPNTEINTMNTDTPETDGEWNRLAGQDPIEFERNLSEFARKLERERDEARDQLRKAQVENDHNWQALVFAVRALKRAKGRFHTQQAAEALFKLLP